MWQKHDPDQRAAAVTAICDEIARGLSLRAICRKEGMPSTTAFMRWLDEKTDEAENYREQYARARELQADHFAEEIIEIADDATNDWMEREGHVEVNSEHIQRSRLRVDSRKWLMARMAPKKYGDKLVNEHVGDPNKPIVVTHIDIVPVTPRLRD